MSRMARILYNGVVVPAARASLPVASRLHPGLRVALEVRRGALERWREAARRRAGRSPQIWIHASSAGESLQAQPLVASIRAARPDAWIAFSFWSPSAARIVADWREVDHADFLPLDLRGWMRRLTAWLEPDAVILVGAETWPNLVWAASERGASVAQACCRLARGSGRLRWPARSITRDVYRRMTAVAAISEDDAARVRGLGVAAEAVAVAGDTRIDATLARAAGAAAQPPPWRPPGNAGPILVAGSTHARDEAALVPALAELRARHPGLVALVAPHDPTPEALAMLEARARERGLPSRRLSSLGPDEGAPLVVIDRIGILYRLYALADAVFVGGAFDGSVHNTMEPAALGAPIVVGPRTGSFHEVAELARAEALVRAGSSDEIVRALERWLAAPAARETAGRAARETLERHRGATVRTLAFLRARGLPL